MENFSWKKLFMGLGYAVGIGTLFGMGFYAAYYVETEIKRPIIVNELQLKHYKEMSEIRDNLREQVLDLKSENQILILKLTNYENSAKK